MTFINSLKKLGGGIVKTAKNIGGDVIKVSKKINTEDFRNKIEKIKHIGPGAASLLRGEGWRAALKKTIKHNVDKIPDNPGNSHQTGSPRDPSRRRVVGSM